MGVVVFMGFMALTFCIAGIILYREVDDVVISALIFGVSIVFGMCAVVAYYDYKNTPDCTHDQVQEMYVNSHNKNVRIKFRRCNDSEKLGSSVVVTLIPKEYEKIMLD